MYPTALVASVRHFVIRHCVIDLCGDLRRRQGLSGGFRDSNIQCVIAGLCRRRHLRRDIE